MEQRFSHNSEILTKTSSGELEVIFGGPAGGNIKFEFVLYLQNAREVVVLHVEFDCRTVFDSDL